jgi:hypothetical protein
MKKIKTSACILLATIMFSPAMAQDGPTDRLDIRSNRIGERPDKNVYLAHRKFDRRLLQPDRRIDRRRGHLKWQRPARYWKGNHGYNPTYKWHKYRLREHKYFRSRDRFRRPMYYQRFNDRFNRPGKHW